MARRPTPKRHLNEQPPQRAGLKPTVIGLAELGAMAISVILGGLLAIVAIVAFFFFVPELVVRAARNLVGDRLLVGALGAFLMVPAVMLGYGVLSGRSATLTLRQWIVVAITVAGVSALGAATLIWAMTSSSGVLLSSASVEAPRLALVP
jgi:hypothetical protein